MLFYPAGELVADRLRAWPNPDRSLIEQDWKPHMTGSMDLQNALAKLVADLATTPPAEAGSPTIK